MHIMKYLVIKNTHNTYNDMSESQIQIFGEISLTKKRTQSSAGGLCL
jgi:hypothetical protein